MSLRLDWLCEWVTLLDKSFTPDTASSCTDPDRLLSLPLRCPSAPKPCCWSEATTCCCNNKDWFGALLVEVFFFAGTPNRKILKMKCKEIKTPPTYAHRTLSHLVRRILQLKIICYKKTNLATLQNVFVFTL